MAFLTMAALGALAGLIGTGISHIQRKTDREYNAQQAQLTRDFTAEENQKAREHDLYMAQNSYQMKSADMEAAGINPAMAFSNSAGATSSHIGGSSSAATASVSSSDNAAGLMNAAANVASVFNNDKNKGNDINLKQALGMISNVASIFK